MVNNLSIVTSRCLMWFSISFLIVLFFFKYMLYNPLKQTFEEKSNKCQVQLYYPSYKSKEKENSNCHPPFQFFLSITSKVGFHHLFPGLVSESNVWFHSVIIIMTSIRHNQLWRPSHFKSMNHKGSPCRVGSYNIT